MTRAGRTGAVLAILLWSLAACGPGNGPTTATSGTPEPTVPTLTPIQLPPDPPPSGRLFADLRQSSRDAALDRMEVWIANDTARDVTPTAITYTDPRFRRPVAGERLRLDPSRSERGYPLTLPSRPACGHAGAAGTVAVTYAGRTVTLPVSDDNDIVQREVDARCLELAVARVADLRFSDDVGVDRPGAGGTGVLTLVLRPTGRPGHTLTIDSVAGTPLFSAAGRTSWNPAERVRSDDPVTRIDLPVQPARCDDHVFMEAAGATAFLVGLHLDGEPGELTVRMSPAGSSAAIAFARESCGLD